MKPWSLPLIAGGLLLAGVWLLSLHGDGWHASPIAAERAGAGGQAAPPRAAASAAMPAAANLVAPDPLIAVGSRDATAGQFPWLTPAQIDDGRRFVRVDIAALRELQVGSSFEVDVSGDGSATTALVDGEQWFEDVRRVTGSWWDAMGGEHRFGLSLASDGSYVAGTFNAADGQQVLEARHGAGWVQGGAARPGLREDM